MTGSGRVGPHHLARLQNTPEVSVTHHAVWRAGSVVTPVIFLHTPPELRHILLDSGATAVVVTPELLPLLRAADEGLELHVLVVGAAGDLPGPGRTPSWGRPSRWPSSRAPTTTWLPSRPLR